MVRQIAGAIGTISLDYSFGLGNAFKIAALD